MVDLLRGLPAFEAFALVWVSAFTVFMTCSLLRLAFSLRRDRQAIGRFLGTGAAMPVLAAYYLAGEQAATRTGILVLSRLQGPSPHGRQPRPELPPLLAALQEAVRDAARADPAEEVMASPRFPTFRTRLREAAQSELPGRRTRYVPDRAASWAALFGLCAVVVYGIGFYVRQPDGSGLWFLIALTAHTPAGIWLGMTDGRSGRYDAPRWPEFDALCERRVAEEEARVPRPEKPAPTDTRPPTPPPQRPGPSRTSGWANDGGVGATSSCGGGCGGGV
ncbi:hypothetical protein [Streptomyces sp. NPDC058657]|uniref:hypothetical protein n=1 Tax=unclassified Streptomyces TaxID=2593676 RepID=UPI00364EF777